MHETTYFVSDLHLFCRRFDGERFWNRLLELSKHANTVVLGGDIFDFRWTTLPTVEHSGREAIQMLTSLVRKNRECEFHYVLGNHDHHQSFIRRLERLAGDESNLSRHPYYLRLGGSLFLHGDVAARPMGPKQLENKRRRWLPVRKQGRLANWAYDASVRVGFHRLAYRLAYPSKTAARRILVYLNQIGQGPAAGVTHVYFGHTHLAMSDFEHDGLRFHNCGAPIRGSAFRILEQVVAD
jgi:UDP-2,3-diacylglucosamine pyrophosphatase LpxH